jgi:hypothetical protein
MICSSQEVGRVSNQTALRGDKEGVIQNVPGDHSKDRHGFLTILDNVLTVGESAGGEERAGRPEPQSGCLLGAGEGVKMVQQQTSLRCSGSSKSVAKNISTLPGPTLKKNINERASIYNCFFNEVFRELCKHTLYVGLSRL